MSSYLAGVLAVMVLFHIAFVIALKIKRNDLADVVWGPGFLVAIIGSVFARFQTEGSLSFLGTLDGLIILCVTVWALRLCLHIGLRNLKKTEDSRYKNWRDTWGDVFVIRSYLQVFILQGVLLLVIAVPALYTIEVGPRSLSGSTWLGFIVWLIGFVFEAVGDDQLRRFKENPENKGKLMTTGLWSWTRHPNYFGEVTQWWGIFLMAVDLSGWWIIISPVTITFLILKVSGVTMLDDLMKSRPGFEAYKRRTSAFFPFPPRKD